MPYRSQFSVVWELPVPSEDQHAEKLEPLSQAHLTHPFVRLDYQQSKHVKIGFMLVNIIESSTIGRRLTIQSVFTNSSAQVS
jgi:hypothetical protein